MREKQLNQRKAAFANTSDLDNNSLERESFIDESAAGRGLESRNTNNPMYANN